MLWREKKNKLRAGSGGQEGGSGEGAGLSLKVSKIGFIEEGVFGLRWLGGDHQGLVAVGGAFWAMGMACASVLW